MGLALDEPKAGDIEVEAGDVTFLLQENEAKGFLSVGVTVDFSPRPGGGFWRVSPNFGLGYGGC
ncbi:MAG: hypothetical protein ABIK09_14120 [Pseudomonadota bacterium]